MRDSDILTSPQLAEVLGCSRWTCWDMARRMPTAGAVIRRTKHSTWWSRTRLIALGILVDDSKPQVAAALAAGFAAIAERLGTHPQAAATEVCDRIAQA